MTSGPTEAKKPLCIEIQIKQNDGINLNEHTSSTLVTIASITSSGNGRSKMALYQTVTLTAAVSLSINPTVISSSDISMICPAKLQMIIKIKNKTPPLLHSHFSPMRIPRVRFSLSH
jgi:hypothetical protein